MEENRRGLFRSGISLLVAIFSALSAMAAGAQDQPVREIPTPGRSITAEDGALPADVDRGGLMIVQFRGEPSEELLGSLRRGGVEIKGFLGNHAYWVRAGAGSALADIPGVRAVVRPVAEDKITPGLARRLPFVAEDGEITVTASFFADARISEVQALLRGLGVEELPGKLLYGGRLHIALRPGAVKGLAESELVNAVEPGPGRKTLLNSKSAKQLGVAGARKKYGLDGSGLSLALWDGGRVGDHREFGDRLTIAEYRAVSAHATHVAGTMAAAGKKKSARGMAPDADIVSNTFDGDVPSEMAKAVKQYGILIANNSWSYTTGWEYIYMDGWGYIWAWFGNADFGRYSSESAAYDKLIFKKGLLIFFAAGNDRGDNVADIVYYDALQRRLVWGLVFGHDGPFRTVGSVGSAKNVFTIGATKGSEMSSFGSWGPTRDGRVKPEVTAPGVKVKSTLPNGKYGVMSGTSMATPAASGGVALLLELWQRLFGEIPSPAVIRAVVATTATDAGSPGPDYKYGFGLLNIEEASWLINRNATSRTILEDKVFKRANKRTKLYSLDIPQGLRNVHVCLAWTDPPAHANAARALVNDLDLRVLDPNSRYFYPWVLNSNKPGKKAKTGVNSVDNIELVLLKKPAAGRWTIEVEASSFGKGSKQKFALVVYSY